MMAIRPCVAYSAPIMIINQAAKPTHPVQRLLPFTSMPPRSVRVRHHSSPHHDDLRPPARSSSRPGERRIPERAGAPSSRMTRQPAARYCHGVSQPLLQAVEAGDFEQAARLLDAGAPIDGALHLAAQRGPLSLVELLIRR